MAVKNFKEEPQPATYLAGEDKDKKTLETVKQWRDDSENFVSTWESNQKKWHKLRMRIKKAKSFPFEGCSNIRMPTVEIKIRKLKSALMNVIFGIRPIIQAIPSPSGNWETARKIEKFLDHLIVDKMGLKEKAIIAIDQSLERGFYLFKPHWRYETTTRVEKLSLDDISVEEAMWLFNASTPIEQVYMAIQKRLQADMGEMVREENKKEIERVTQEILSGADEVTFTLKDILYNCPDVSLCPPERIYVPPTTGFDPQKASYIIHEFFMPFHDIRANADKKGWKLDSILSIEDKKSVDLQDKDIDATKDEREGIERLQSGEGLVKVQECYCWYDINGDGVEEKCVITIAPDFDKVLKEMTLPFYSGKFPFVKLFYELIDDRWFSHRGIPELIEDIVKEIDVQHMQKIDSQTMRNAPMFIYRSGMVNPKTVQFTFGQGIPAHGMQPLGDLIAPLNSQNSNVEFSYEREQMILETKVEELIGQVDFTLQSMINKRQPRTLGEVQMQQQNMQQVFSLDADMFREQFAKLFNWVWDLWSQYGDDEYEFMYFGGDNSKGETIKLSREETQAKYKITVRGNDQNTNPQIKMQKAQQIMMAAQQPLAVQMGLITPVHLANIYKRFFVQLDIPNWEELVATPEQIMQQMKQPKAPPPDDIKFKAEDLTDAEKAQALKKRGIQPDIRGRMMNEQNRRETEGFDQLMQVAEAIGGDDEPKRSK